MADEFDDAFDEVAAPDEEVIEQQDEDVEDGGSDQSGGVEPDAEVAEVAEPEGESAAKPEFDATAALAKLQAERDQWVQKYKSQEGRFHAAQRQMQELADKKRAGESVEIDDFATDERFKDVVELYPELPALMAAREQRLREKIKEEFRPVLEEIRSKVQKQEVSEGQRRHQTYIQTQVAALDAAHPDWREVKEDPEFKNWAVQQPPYKSQVITNSTDAGEIASILEEFKLRREVAKWKKDNGGGQQKLAAQNKRLERSRSVPTKQTSGGFESLPNDFDAAFEALT